MRVALRISPTPWHRASALALIVVLWTTVAHANTYSVGPVPPCTHATLQEAINAAVATPSATQHVIKLTTGTLTVPNGLLLHNPASSVRIAGGYTSCSGEQGTGTRTILDATGGNDGTVLDIRNFGAAARLISLDRLDITGGTGETGLGSSSEGAGLELRGGLSVFLTDTRVRDNRAFRAAGVLLQGGPGFVLFSIGAGSNISGNIADTDGGGIWCIDQAYTQVIDGGIIEFNRAGRDGGGVWLADRCEFTMYNSLTAQSAINILANNVAGEVFGGRGGGVFYQATTPRSSSFAIDISGTSTGPAFIVGNQALRVGSSGGEGGVLYLEGTGANRIPVRVNNAVMINNSAQRAGSAISVRRGISLSIDASGARCSGTFGFGLCSAVVGADTVALDVAEPLGVGPAQQPAVLVHRTRFTGNTGEALIKYETLGTGGGGVVVDTSVFDANNVDFLMIASRPLALHYSTAIGNTVNGNGSVMPALIRATTSGIVSMDLKGSVIWQPSLRLLSHPIAPDRISATHEGCLLSSDLTGVVNPSEVRTSNPQLGADFSPALTSPALDVCNIAFVESGADAYGTTRPVDRAEAPNALGAYDLGAVEFPPPPPPDVLFANSFE